MWPGFHIPGIQPRGLLPQTLQVFSPLHQPLHLLFSYPEMVLPQIATWPTPFTPDIIFPMRSFLKIVPLPLPQGSYLPVLFCFSKAKLLSCVWFFATPWTVAYQAPLSMEFSRQEYWSGLPFPSPGDLPDAGIEPGSHTLQADALSPEPPGKPSS